MDLRHKPVQVIVRTPPVGQFSVGANIEIQKRKFSAPQARNDLRSYIKSVTKHFPLIGEIHVNDANGHLFLDKDQSSDLISNSVQRDFQQLNESPYVLTVKHDGNEPSVVEHCCSGSMEVSLFMGDELSADDIIKKADESMYRAKDAGGNRCEFYS